MPFAVGLPPPCHVQKSLSVPLLGPESVRLFAGTSVVSLMELNTMQTPVWQPAQAGVPTVFVFLMVRLYANYS